VELFFIDSIPLITIFKSFRCHPRFIDRKALGISYFIYFSSQYPYASWVESAGPYYIRGFDQLVLSFLHFTSCFIGKVADRDNLKGIDAFLYQISGAACQYACLARACPASSSKGPSVVKPLPSAWDSDFLTNPIVKTPIFILFYTKEWRKISNQLFLNALETLKVICEESLPLTISSFQPIKHDLL